MASNVRAFPQIIPPQPSQQGWTWNGSSWVWDCDDQCPPPGGGCWPQPPPFPCPPTGFPTPCPPWFPPPAAQAPWYPGANGGVTFSATAPINPIRGNLWWDGTMFRLFDGAAWVDIGPEAGPPGVPGAPGTPGTSGSTFVGMNPPTNPVTGQDWWNGTTFQVWDGAKWNAVGPSLTTGPVPTTTRVFALQQPSALTVGTSSAWAMIPYTTTPTIDTQGAYDPVSHKFTPKKAGMYNFSLRGVAVGGGGIAIAMNDPGTFASVSSDTIVGVASLNTTTGWMMCSGFQPMNGSSDYVRAWAWSATNPMSGAGANNVFTATLLP